MSIRYDALWPTNQEQFNRNLVDFFGAPLFPTVAIESNPSGTPDANTLYAGLIPKAWLRFNMATDAIADSFNVSSITDEAAGLDTLNWDRDFLSGDYAILLSHNNSETSEAFVQAQATPAVGSLLIGASNSAAVATDLAGVSVLIFGDQ